MSSLSILIVIVLIFGNNGCGTPCNEESEVCCTNGCGCVDATNANIDTYCTQQFADCSAIYCGGTAGITCAAGFQCIIPDGSTGGDCVQIGESCTCPNPPVSACRAACVTCPTDSSISYGCCGECQYQSRTDEKGNQSLVCDIVMTTESICPEATNCGTCGNPAYYDGCNTCQCNADGSETCTDYVCKNQGTPYCINEGDSCETCTPMMKCPAKQCVSGECGGCCGECEYVFNDKNELECGEVVNVCLEDSCESETMEYNACVSACGLPTCGGSLQQICLAMCVPACKCKDGYPYYDSVQGKCITERECHPINCETCGTAKYSNGCNVCVCNEDGTEACDDVVCVWEGIPECLPDTTDFPCPVYRCMDPCGGECLDGGECVTDTPIDENGCEQCAVFEYCDLHRNDTNTTDTPHNTLSNANRYGVMITILFCVSVFTSM